MNRKVDSTDEVMHIENSDQRFSKRSRLEVEQRQQEMKSMIGYQGEEN